MVLVVSLAGFAACKAEEVPTEVAELEERIAELEAGPVTLEVYNPTGAFEVAELHAPRLDTLAGKTICELSNGSWQAHRAFLLIRELLLQQFPDATIVPYTEFPTGIGPIDTDETAKMLKEKGCQAAIVGNAG